MAYFPAWETLPHERLSPRSDTSGRRLAVLRRLAHPDPASPRTAAVTALLDRLLHHAHVLKCGPRSWRTKVHTDLRSEDEPK